MRTARLFSQLNAERQEPRMSYQPNQNSTRCVDSPTRQYFMDGDGQKKSSEKSENLTLADIKRRARREAEEARNDNHIKRFQMLNFTSEDSRHLDEASLRSYYCSICGHLSVVTEGDIGKLPVYHGYRVLQLKGGAFSKVYLTAGEEVLIRHDGGVVEWRAVYRCVQCEFQLAHRVKTGELTDSFTSYMYIPIDGLVAHQGDAAAILFKTEPKSLAV